MASCRRRADICVAQVVRRACRDQEDGCRRIRPSAPREIRHEEDIHADPKTDARRGSSLSPTAPGPGAAVGDTGPEGRTRIDHAGVRRGGTAPGQSRGSRGSPAATTERAEDFAATQRPAGPPTHDDEASEPRERAAARPGLRATRPIGRDPRGAQRRTAPRRAPRGRPPGVHRVATFPVAEAMRPGDPPQPKASHFCHEAIGL
jgi:hypothetical protein